LYNQTFSDSRWSDKCLEKYFSATGRHPICISIKNGEQLIGLAIGRLTRENKTKILLSTLSVSPRFLKNGYGNALMKKFFRATLAVPMAQSVLLHFRESNKGVLNFYFCFGFKNHKICGKYSNGEKNIFWK
jgi:ribosomal protein S18 acetylase RimI-like enzyme